MFRNRKAVIGMVHLKPLRAAPGFRGDFEAVVKAALEDAKALEEGGCDGILVENLGDAPYYKDNVPASTIADMSRILTHIRKRAKIPFGVNVLRNDALSAMAIAAAVDASFIRVNILSGAMLTDQGIIEGRAAELLRLRKQLGADHILILADASVKHAQPIGAKWPIEREAEDLKKRGLADAVIVSGPATGAGASFQDILMVRDAVGKDFPVLIGSGLSVKNCRSMLEHTDGAIVGTSLKVDGSLENPVDIQRVRELVQAVREI
ncbi:MAG: BtpA/SgcQ family protein [Thermoplasmata archaeon]